MSRFSGGGSDSDSDGDEENDTQNEIKLLSRPIKRKRGAACRACCHACWMHMLDSPTGPIFVVSLLVASGLMAAIWAMVYSGDYWHYPLYNTLAALLPLFPLFCLGGADEIERIAAMSSSEARDEANVFRVDEKQYAFGWFLMGAFIMIPFGSPVLLGQMTMIPRHLVWISALGSWCLAASVVLGVAFSIRLSYHQTTR